MQNKIRSIGLVFSLILIAVMSQSCTSTSSPPESSATVASNTTHTITSQTPSQQISSHVTTPPSTQIITITRTTTTSSPIITPYAPTTAPSTSLTTSPTTITPTITTPITTTTPTTPVQTTIGEATVVRIIDGDTIEVAINNTLYKVRYIGIDTPETAEHFGQEATNKNAELLSSKIVRLEKDISETDSFGRLLRYVYVGDLSVNAELVRLGYAQAIPYPPDVRYQNLFTALEQEAKTAKIGIWALSLQIVSVTSPVKAGAYATLNAKTVPNAQCSITVYYNSGPSQASGLTSQNANSNGDVQWTWKVGINTSTGNGIRWIKSTPKSE